MPFFDFYLILILFFLFLIAKKGGFYSTDPDADVARVADVARGTTARMQCSTEATWQGREWPTRGAGGAQGADMWKEAMRVHADAREGRHVAGGVGR